MSNVNIRHVEATFDMLLVWTGLKEGELCASVNGLKLTLGEKKSLKIN